MSGDTRSFDVPATVIAALGATAAVTGAVVFKWNGPPDDRTVETAITVRSAANFSSVRQFLAASGIAPRTGLHALRDSHSIRALLGV